MGEMIKTTGKIFGSVLNHNNYFRTSEGVTLYFEDWGQGKPIVLIHGWPLNCDMWEYQASGLVEQGFRVIKYDRRGFGRSSKPFQDYHFDQLATDLHELIVHLNLSDITLVGFSMGGGEIARYLKKYGHARVEKAVLVSSVVPYLLKTYDNAEGVDESVFEKIQASLKDDRQHFVRNFTKDFYGVGLLTSPVSEEIMHWTFGMAMQASPKATYECVSSYALTDFREDLSAFTMPTLVIHGTEDKTVPMEATGLQAAMAIPGASLKKYEGAPHGLFITHKDELLEDIAAFVSSQRHLDHLSPHRIEEPRSRPLRPEINPGL